MWNEVLCENEGMHAYYLAESSEASYTQASDELHVKHFSNIP